MDGDVPFIERRRAGEKLPGEIHPQPDWRAGVLAGELAEGPAVQAAAPGGQRYVNCWHGQPDPDIAVLPEDSGDPEAASADGEEAVSLASSGLREKRYPGNAEPTELQGHLWSAVTATPQKRRATEMEEPKKITVLGDKQGFTVTVKENGTPGTWELEWTGVPDAGRVRRMLNNAETQVLRNGGEVLVVNCPEEQAAVRNRLEKWPEHIRARTGDRYRLQLIYEAEDGLVHDDFDFRTPLHRITCPTCVERFARKRTRAREDAFDEYNGPREIAGHTRLVAEAYIRLAEIEEDLDLDELRRRTARGRC